MLYGKGGLRFKNLISFVMLAALAVATVVFIIQHQRGTSKTPDLRRCAYRVTAYLQQAVTQRAEFEAQEMRARAELNEARSVLEEERSGQRVPKAETKERIKAALVFFESSLAMLQKFDEAVMTAHKDLPQQCVFEVNALRSSSSRYVLSGNFVLYAFEAIKLHFFLYGETLRGVIHFFLLEYDAIVWYYKRIFNYYHDRSQKVFDELQLRQRDRCVDDEGSVFWEMIEVAFLYSRGVLYASIPYMLLFSVSFFGLLFLPFVISAILLPNFVWNLWVKVFIMYYVYELSLDGFLISLRQYVELVVDKKWTHLQNRFGAALTRLVNGGIDENTFFNGIIATVFILFTVLLLVDFIYTWVMFLVSLVEPTVDALRKCSTTIKRKKDTVMYLEKPAASVKRATRGTANGNILKMSRNDVNSVSPPMAQRPSTNVNSSFLHWANDGGSVKAEKFYKKCK